MIKKQSKVVKVQTPEERASSMPVLARQLVIKTQHDYIKAADFLKDVKSLRGEIDKGYDDLISTAYKAHKEIVAKKRSYEAPLIEAEGVVKGLIASYTREQQRIEQEKLDRARREEEERLRKQIESDNEKRAEELYAQGKVDEAAEVLQEEVVVAPDTLPPTVAAPAFKMEGGPSIRKLYKVQSVDLKKLVAAINAGERFNMPPVECVEADMTFLGKQASAFKREGEIYPGVFVVAVDSVASGR